MLVAFLVTETFDRGVKLSKDDLKVATELWDNVINPACIQFEKQTGKPAEAMREAIAGVIVNRVNQHNSWNAWQKLWWKKFPKVDKALRRKSYLFSIIAHSIKYICRATHYSMPQRVSR